ncbi:Acyl-CoA synthetase (AMP-forming)/AMP-acid ligase II [Devosia lucknowensis]|uniref:Acyl-CoA synthetase (AMP-forming)/AMP-acid ligase II n=1 Tax=Devosia lucknowensis TaxID=1096929 RepID=A0A1Y6GDS4_9HYPH|nr:AMP-binding protein [Devosia lucknowensis]SMQ86229.1 Acyl-CoA synthetase (AMP-forming)/AMP-acid ligase II [Devosia lucknowensis]
MFFAPQQLRAFGSAPCLVHDGRIFGYAELADMAEAAANALPSRPQLIALEMAATPEAIARYVGALGAGHAVMPLLTDHPELAATAVERFRPGASWQRVDGEHRLAFHDHPAHIHPDLSLLLQTSGSTGQGKGVRLSASAVQANADAIAKYLRITPSDRAALVLPLHYSYGLSVLHSHLIRGASFWLADQSVLAPGFKQALNASGATSLAGVPHHFTLLESAGLDRSLPERVNCLTVAGGAMKPDRVRHWAATMAERQGRFVVMYGQTEATARIAYLPDDLALRFPEAIGRAIPGGALSLMDEKGRAVTKAGMEGELVYRGPNVMMGYAESAEDLGKGPELEQLLTGDLATRDADGIYRITGRRSRMSKIAGLRIGHDALEQALAQAGHDVAVWGNDKSIWIASSGALDGMTEQAARLAGIGTQNIVLVPVPELPRLASGKVDYVALRKLEGTGPKQRDVLPAFAQTFAPHPVAAQDSFVSLGGDSLQHVELSLELEHRFGGVPDRWEYQSIAQLEQVPLEMGTRVATPILVRALAILAVVVTHQTLWPVYGGAAAMIILLGLSVAQHRREPLVQWDPVAFLKPTLRVLGPYVLVLLGFAVAWGQMPWASLLLVSNFGLTAPETHLMLPYLYWFIEAYMQMTLLVLILCWPAPVRQLIASRPFEAGMALLVLALLLRLVPEFWPLHSGRSQFTVPWVFYLFALGWCIAFAQSARQRLILMGAAAIALSAAAYMGGNWYGGWIKYMSLLGVVAVLVHVPQVRMPRVLVLGAMHIARAAFMIYLLHRLVPEVIMPLTGMHLPRPVDDIVAITGGVGLGLLGFLAQQRLARLPWRQVPKRLHLARP